MGEVVDSGIERTLVRAMKAAGEAEAELKERTWSW
jgi:hypothetical protein